MGCKKAIADPIIAKGADCVLAVKDTQPQLHGAIRHYFDTDRAADFTTAVHPVGGAVWELLGCLRFPASPGPRIAQRGTVVDALRSVSATKTETAMVTIREEYLIDQAGNRKAVVLPLAEWQQIKEELEELDEIRAYDKAKRHPSEPVPFEQVMAELQGKKRV